MQELNATTVSIKHEVLRTQKKYFEDLNYYGKIHCCHVYSIIAWPQCFYSGVHALIFVIFFLGVKLKGVADAAKNYHVVLEENRRLYNEVQELKGKTLLVKSTLFA